MDVKIQPPTQLEFSRFQNMIETEMGIYLPPQKIALLNSRLSKRLTARNCSNFSEYFRLIHLRDEGKERQTALELITTNETYFFREPKHFDYLANHFRFSNLKRELRVWSAACSSGEEAYSTAMVLQEHYGGEWKILASDINQAIMDKAKAAIYPDTACQRIPSTYRYRYCRKGIGSYTGFMRVSPTLRNNVDFLKINLAEDLPRVGKFDLVFLRNVMIYFEKHTQQKVLKRIQSVLNPGGLLFVGHSESLHGVSTAFEMLNPAIYRIKS